MESSKRARQEVRNYNDRRNYNKRTKSGVESSKIDLPANVLIFDNGGYSIKVGYNKDKKPMHLPNHIMKAKSERKRVFIADQIEDCRDLSGLYFITPHERGYITKFDVQKNIWDYTFNKFPIDDNTVMMTQPIFNFRTIQEFTDEVFFEEYDVRSLFKANPTDYAYYNYIKQFKGRDTSCIVIDSGFSFTHIVPYIDGKKYAHGITRLNIGGKLLTNYLKDIISYRQLHVMEETYVINQVKEDTCYMAQNFSADLTTAKSTNEIVKTYVLPDFHNIRRGYIQTDPEEDLENYQILRLNNERITIPEVMIRPSIINGLEVAGLAECIWHSIKKCPVHYRKDMCANIVLIGGNTLFKGFKERLEKETRIFLPCDYDLKMFQPEDTINYAWTGGKKMSGDPRFKALVVTKQEYEEHGNSYTYNKFNKFAKHEDEEPKVDPGSSEPFSYLNYWKNEGVDLLGKGEAPPEQEPNVTFKLEGDNIEEYDGKYVTIEFEYEKKEEEKEKEKEKVAVVVKQPEVVITEPTLIRRKLPTVASTATVVTAAPTPRLITIPFTRTLTPTTTTLTPRLVTTSTVTSSSIGNLSLVRGNQIILNSMNSVLPSLTRIQPKILRPVYRPITSTLGPRQTKITQYISLANTNISQALIVPSTSGTTRTVVTQSQLLNNAVLLPQKNLTFQIIPIRPEMMQQGNIIIAKKPQ